MADSSIQAKASLQAQRAALGLTDDGSHVRTGPVPVPDAVSKRRETAIFVAFIVMALSVTLLQCFGVPIGADNVVPLALPVFGLSLAVLCYFVRPKIDPLRLGLYFLVMLVAIPATAVFAVTYSPASLALFVVLYAPLVLSFPVSEASYRRCLGFFSSVMVVAAGLEFLQHAIQLVVGPQAWPDPYKLLPLNILVPNYNYMQPLVWRSHFDKPQAFFFLETSFLSQYIAIALAIEIVLFRRVKRMALFTAALFATFAGTGVLLIIVSLPILIRWTSVRNMLLVIIVLLVVGGIAAEAGWLDTVGSRFTEFQRTGGSANHRFVEPFDRVVEFLGKPGSLYSGIGAGQIEKTDNHQFWPIAKAVVEYGLLTGLLFYAFFVYVMFDRPPSRALAFTLLFWFTFEGALLTAVNPLTCMLLSSMFLIEREPGANRRPGATGQRAGRAGDRMAVAGAQRR